MSAVVCDDETAVEIVRSITYYKTPACPVCGGFLHELGGVISILWRGRCEECERDVFFIEAHTADLICKASASGEPDEMECVKGEPT